MELGETEKVIQRSCQIGETHYNTTLKMGMHSGKFKEMGLVDNMEDCIEQCCKENDVDAAFLLGNLCYSVKCYNSDLCQTRPAFVSNVDMIRDNPAVVFIHNNNDNKGTHFIVRMPIIYSCYNYNYISNNSVQLNFYSRFRLHTQ